MSCAQPGIRRDAQERAYYLVFAPAGSSLAELAGAAGLRWTIEECFQPAKEELGLDHCEARSWHGWHRHMTLCMAALGFLAGLSAQLRRVAGCATPHAWRAVLDLEERNQDVRHACLAGSQRCGAVGDRCLARTAANLERSG